MSISDLVYRQSARSVRENAEETKFKKYRRTGIAEMKPWESGMDMTEISIAGIDKALGSPCKGDMIARNPKDHNDLWLVAKKYFQDNFELFSFGSKTLHNSDVSGARENVRDIKVVGNGDQFRLLSKASSEKEGWMKSTKAMETEVGCLVQVTTQQRNPDGTYAVAEALAFVPCMRIVNDVNDGRKLVLQEMEFVMEQAIHGPAN